MRYFTQLEGHKEPVPVDIESIGPGQYQLRLNGTTHTVDALMLPHGVLSLQMEGRAYAVDVDERADSLQVHLRGQSFKIDVADERKMRQRAATASFTVEGRQLITAPMPGKVTKLLVKLGDEVKEGQGLVVVEAMKMENELKSPKAGKVVELFAQEGSTVENNAKLLTVE